MSLFLVRHAKAGNRRRWLEHNQDDRPRPLDDQGQLQSLALARRLAQCAPTSLWSSPFVRCVETLAPLAVTCGLEIRQTECLAEDNDYEPFLDLLTNCADGAVICSHGDMIPLVTSALERRGMVFSGQRETRKGSVIVLDRLGDVFIAGHAWPPPII